MSIFRLPDLGEGLPDATVREWYVKVGDTVTVDQPLVAMETAKALVDVPSPQNGVIAELHGTVDDVLDTGSVLITFESEKSAQAESASESGDSGTVVGVIDSSETLIAADSIVQATHDGPRVLATPAVRQLATQLGVAIDSIKPAGSCVSREDIKAAAKHVRPKATANPISSFSGDALALNSARRAMIQSMQASQAQVVPVTLTGEANIQAWVGKEDMSCRILKALCAACKAEPNLNAHFDADNATLYRQEHVNCGMAVDTPEGLFVPVIHQADTLNAAEQRDIINRYKEQAASKSIPAADLKGATIILSNIGTVAGLHANPILIPPMVCIVATGRARDAVVPVNGEAQICRLLPLSVTIDHRAITGGELSRFLKALITALEE